MLHKYCSNLLRDVSKSFCYSGTYLVPGLSEVPIWYLRELMPTVKMTVRSIDAIKLPTSGQIDYWDADNPGFGLRIAAGGRKAWVLMYRHGGIKRRLSVGTYPALSLADARQKAAKARHRVEHDGADPAAEKKADRAADTVADVAREFLNFISSKRRVEGKYRQIIEKDVVPRFGRWKAAAITRRDIRSMLDDIVARGAPVQANRTLSVTRRMFNWAIGRDLGEIENNPCQGLPKPASENSRDRVLTEDEIRAVWAAWEAETPLTAAVFKLRLLTAQRGAEVLAMRWDQIADGGWTIPALVAKNGMAHRVPLAFEVVKLLEKIRPLGNGSDWVFPHALGDGHRVAINKAHARIVARSAVKFVPHDLRRTAASLMTGMGIGRLTVSKILNHVDRTVTAVYDRHGYDAEKRMALEAWAKRLHNIIVNDRTAAGNVLEMKAA